MVLSLSIFIACVLAFTADVMSNHSRCATVMPSTHHLYELKSHDCMSSNNGGYFCVACLAHFSWTLTAIIIPRGKNSCEGAEQHNFWRGNSQ